MSKAKSASPSQTKVKKKKRNDFFFVCKHVKFSWGLIILALVVGCVQSVITSTVPDATANLFDGDFSTGKLWGVAQTLLITLILGLISYIVRVFAESKSTLAARKSVWERMIHAGMDYYDANDAASRLSMITVDAQTMGAGLVQLFVSIPTYAVLLLSCVFQLFTVSPRLLTILWLLIPMHILYFFVMGRWQQKVGAQYTCSMGDLTGYLAERIRNLPMIKNFATEEQEDKNGIRATGWLYQVMITYNVKIGAVIAAYQTLSTVASTVLAVLWGCHLLKTGEVTLTDFLAFSMYIASINVTFVVISTVWTFVKDFSGRATRLAGLLEASAEPHGKQDKGSVQVPNGDLSVEGISFCYPTADAPTLSNVSFTIPQGKVTALVGPSGSGKTTLIKLLERLYAPTQGRITVGGTDISTLNLEAWRKKISYVVQDAGVFSGTLRDALCYSVDRPVSDEELHRVIAEVDLTSFVQSLPKGLDTVLANWGGSLSGGQRQRIVIARAILRDSDIYIFDEPTSALDPETANTISRIILQGFQGKTVLIVSHELNFIAQADHIVVVNLGEMAGAGSHNALMQNCPVYRNLVEEQSYQEVFGA